MALRCGFWGYPLSRVIANIDQKALNSAPQNTFESICLFFVLLLGIIFGKEV